MEHAPSHTRAHTHILTDLAQFPALLYLATNGFSENKEMSGHLLLQSSVVSCVVMGQNNPLLIMPEENLFFITYFACPRFLWEMFFYFIFLLLF